VKFKGGIGVIPVSSAAGVANANGTFPDVNRNTVRGVNPPGQIWTIADLRAEVNVDGRIKVRGRGLLLAGGNSIGTNAGQSVFATLICVAPDGTFTLHSTDSDDVTAGIQGVPLEATATSESTIFCRRHRRTPASGRCSSSATPPGPGSPPASRSMMINPWFGCAG